MYIKCFEISHMHIHTYIYIYIERERERERFSVMDKEEISLATKRYTNHTTWTKSAVY